MLVKYHIILGAIISTIIYFVFHITFLQTTIIFLSSFLIDIDHYFLYIFKQKNINPLKAQNHFLNQRKRWIKLSKKEKQKFKKPILVFHGMEFTIFLTILIFYNPIFIFVLIGVLIHLILDYADQIYHKDKIYSKLSQVYVYTTNKDKT